MQINKNRNSKCNIYKKLQHNNNSHKNLNKTLQKIKYKKLSKSYLYFEELSILKRTKKAPCYVEYENEKRNNRILNISYIIDKKINTNPERYRSLNNTCVIETIAKSFAHSILVEDNFNVFKSFNNLANEIKIYKKEAKILTILLISNLITIYKKLQNDVYFIKEDILLGLKSGKICKNTSYARIYGVYILNPHSSKILLLSSQKIFEATNFVIKEFDNILLKQKIIYNYVIYLFGNL